MAGALMFVVYGDPVSGRSPTVSIRTVPGHGHTPPRPVTADDAGQADVRIMRSQWLQVDNAKNEPTFVASMGAVCYGCSLWPGSRIDISDTSQPWIWAWNDHQDMARVEYSNEASLEVHNFGAGGWGLFYVDMKSSTSHKASLPQLKQGVAAIGSSTFPVAASKFTSTAPDSSSGSSNFLTALGEFGLSLGLVHLHAFLMGAAFLFLFPMGVVAILSGSRNAFRFHWVLQATATMFAGLGAIVGLIMSGRQPFAAVHQIVGIAIVLALSVQVILGLRHHVIFLRVRHRTWVSQAHAWLGRCVVVGGLGNILSGIVMAGHAKSAVFWLVSALIILGTASLTTWIYLARRRLRMLQSISGPDVGAATSWRGSSFALDDDSDEDSDEDGK
ncbi:integral membrane protein [Colletotrichum asianum]